MHITKIIQVSTFYIIAEKAGFRLTGRKLVYTISGGVAHAYQPPSTANIKAVRGSLWWLSVNKLSHIPELQSVSAVYKNQ